MAKATDASRIEALEEQNKKLRSDLDKAMKAIDKLSAQLRDVHKRANTAYHASRDAGNQIQSINSTLRRRG